MNKSKILAFAIWLLTLILPFKAGFLDEAKPNMFTLVMFLLTLVGVATGALFFSKTQKA